MGDRLRLRHVADVEDVAAMLPVADIEAIADPQRMVAARRDIVVPGIVLAARGPLARNPPAPDLERPCRIRQIEDHRDGVDLALAAARAIEIADAAGIPGLRHTMKIP